APARRDDRVDRRRTVALLQINDSDGHSVCGQTLGDGRPDPAGAACHHRYPLSLLRHLPPLLVLESLVRNVTHRPTPTDQRTRLDAAVMSCICATPCVPSSACAPRRARQRSAGSWPRPTMPPAGIPG